MIACAAAVLCAGATFAAAADLEEARSKLNTGQYDECVKLADAAIAQDVRDEDWWLLKTRALLATGQFPEAREAITAAQDRFFSSIRVRLLAHRVYQSVGDVEAAQNALASINRLVVNAPWRYSDEQNLVAQGRAALLLGADARQVLELLYDRVRKESPGFAGGYLASGELALNKHDDVVAERAFGEGVKRFPDDPDLLFGLARALASSNPPGAAALFERVLQINPNHVDAILYEVDHLIDGEREDEADDLLDKVLSINPNEPRAWAYRAVLAHLRNDAEGEEGYRQRALQFWATNPAVDYLIGWKLSQKYRFAEGAQYQRRALEHDAEYLPARMQLAQDLLRLGEVEEGWKLAQQVHEADGYDVVAYNLVNLQDAEAAFRTIRDDDFIVRMDPTEADVYGSRVLDLLHRAKTALTAKYDMKLTEPVTVEIFPQQKDFAIRTFGLPGGEGFLGVCFGKVITANSPASQAASPNNWQAVLWHEFCHVVTLQKTRNRMPRWLSEGISVYEEKQADATWGEAMTPQYRQMVLDSELTPIHLLSSAFLNPPTVLHLQFAYYESALVVEFIIKRAGLDALKAILTDLAAGVDINETIQRRVGPMQELEEAFETFAQERALALAPKADWQRGQIPAAAKADVAALADWLVEHPSNIEGLTLYVLTLIADEKYELAKGVLRRLIELYPDQTGAASPYALLAMAHRALKDSAGERAALEAWASRDSEAVDAYLRLMDLAAADKDWPAVVLNAKRMLAVNPLVPQPHRHLALACEALGDNDGAIQAYRALLAMDPPDPAEAHYRLARLLAGKGQGNQAKRQVLMALEEAPRYRDAHRLLLSITKDQPAAGEAPKPAPPSGAAPAPPSPPAAR